jgi:hypothetical protein
MGHTRLLLGSLAGLLISVLLFLLVGGYAALVFVAALLGGGSVVGALVDLAVPWLLVAGLLVVTGVVSLLGLLYGLARRAADATFESERATALAERAEREVPGLEALGLSETLEPPEPTAEERAERALADLKSQYVAGEITEREFERRVDRLVACDGLDSEVDGLDSEVDGPGSDGGGLDPARAERERQAVIEDAEGGVVDGDDGPIEEAEGDRS